jgi:glycosyltransferase involved in cell wall biosynthesis
VTYRTNLVVFSDDWGRHPSSCQHLVSHLLDEFEVTWINTIGTRPPALNLTTMRRGFEKLRQWGQRPSHSPRGGGSAPRVVNPLMWPSFQFGWERRLNAILLKRCLQWAVPNLNDTIILTTVPIVADLVGHFPAAQWVYYCVDDFSQWPGLDGQTLKKMETALIDRVDVIVAAGENLATRVRQRGHEPAIITHGVDLDHWWHAGGLPPALNVTSLQHPIALFWGLIDRRLDIAWLRTLADAMTTGSIVLIGPQQSPDPALKSIPRLHLTGPLPYKELPRAAAAADVLIMPYADMPVTRAMQPLKLKEYLATGKPVVVRDLPATRAWDDCLDASHQDDEFARAVLRRWQEGVPPEQAAARRRLADESWKAKARSLRDLLDPRPANAVEVIA